MDVPDKTLQGAYLRNLGFPLPLWINVNADTYLSETHFTTISSAYILPITHFQVDTSIAVSAGNSHNNNHVFLLSLSLSCHKHHYHLLFSSNPKHCGQVLDIHNSIKAAQSASIHCHFYVILFSYLYTLSYFYSYHYYSLTLIFISFK